MMEEYITSNDGDKIRWFGSTLFNDNAIGTAKGFEYANEAQGDIIYTNGTKIFLNWDDVNISDNHLKGTLTLLVDTSGSRMVKELGSSTGGFGPSEWTRKC